MTLGNLGRWGSGGTPLASRSDFYGGEIPWLIIEDLNDGMVSRAKRSITSRGLENSSARVVPAGTLLIAMYGSIGKLGISTMPCATNQAIAYCECNPDLVDVRFLFYLLLHERSQFLYAGRGGTQQNISQEFLKSYEVDVPELADQRRAVEVLSRADRFCGNRQYALELTDSLLAAAFRQCFANGLKEGPFARLGDLVDITGGGTPPRERPEYFEGHIPWLTSKDMRGDYIWDTEEHITPEAVRNSATKVVPADSILVVVKSKVLLHRLPVAVARVKLCHGQDIKSIQCHEGTHFQFVRFMLKHHEQRLLDQARGANTEGLTLSMLQELPVPLVDESDQQRFASIAERHDRLRAMQGEASRQAEHLFGSLLNRYFGSARSVA